MAKKVWRLEFDPNYEEWVITDTMEKAVEYGKMAAKVRQLEYAKLPGGTIHVNLTSVSLYVTAEEYA